MKKINKVIAATMIMAITAAMPAMAVNKKNVGYDKRAKVVVVLDERGPHHYRHHAYGHRPDTRVCAFRVSHYSSPRHMVAKAERIHGVIDAHFSPRTHEVIVRYDARRTTAHHIRHIMDSHHPHGRY